MGTVYMRKSWTWRDLYLEVAEQFSIVLIIVLRIKVNFSDLASAQILDQK